MKRDFDLIREILLQIENSPDNFNAQSMKVPAYEDEMTMYNVKLLINSGYIDGRISPSKQGTATYIGNLTYDGHDLLDSIRDKGFFAKVKEYTKEKGVPLTFETIKLAAPIVTKLVFGE